MQRSAAAPSQWTGPIPHRVRARFADRGEAGRVLAGALDHLRGQPVVVLGLPRGGVPVAFEVARALSAPLDVVMVRKLGVPFQPELAMGAIGEGGVRVVDDEIVREAGVTARELEAIEERERAELERRVRRYRGERPPVPVEGRTAVIVDDGIATGSTARAACRVVRARGAARIVLAVPVAPEGWIRRMGGDADEYVSVETPSGLFAVGQSYADFSQTSDTEVAALLARAAAIASRDGKPDACPHPGTPQGLDPPRVDVDRDVEVAMGDLHLPGHVVVPADPLGMVVFAHGSGSSRHSPRNRHVAAVLHGAGLGTLLFDLLTEEEELSRENVFDVELLATRLAGATDWLRAQRPAPERPVGYFGASTGAAAALWAAAADGAEIAAVVSRGGRPDLAGPRLASVRSPTLLVVGGHDEQVLRLNEWALSRLHCEAQLEVVPGATHLFEEPGTLEAAAELARDWFVRHFTTTAGSGPPVRTE